MKNLADPAAERRTKSQARRGLAIYFALLIPLSAVFVGRNTPLRAFRAVPRRSTSQG